MENVGAWPSWISARLRSRTDLAWAIWVTSVRMRREENPIDRYLINSPMIPTMKKNPDGSLTLYIQKDSPGADKESNWLPAPNGPTYLIMRLYWPKTETPSILPPGEGTWQLPA